MLGRSSPYCWTFVEEKKLLLRKNWIERSLLSEHWWKGLWWEKFVEEKLYWEIFVGRTFDEKNFDEKSSVEENCIERSSVERTFDEKTFVEKKGDGQNGSIWQNYFGSFRNWARLVLNYSFLQGQYLIGVSLRTIAGRGWGRSVALRWPSLPRVLSGSFAFHLTTTRRSGISTHLCTGVSGRDMV